MRKQFLGYLFIGLLIFASAGLDAALPLCILSVTDKGHMTKDKFTRISEYFTGIEDTGGDTIFRTDGCGREGIYLVVGLNRSVSRLSEGAYLKFSYLLSDSKREEEVTFEIDPKCGHTRWIYLGVTGINYHGPCQYFVAWSIEIHSNEEHVVQNSFLWRMGG